MQKISKISLTLFSFLLIAGCATVKTTEETSSTETTVVVEETITEETPNVGSGKIKQINIEAKINKLIPDSYVLDIDTAYIIGNNLYIMADVPACSNVDFEFVGSPAIMKSLPPKRGCQLRFITENECTVKEKASIIVDITELAVTEEHGSEIVLLLEKYNPLKYTYE